jgi:hypothetical protein
MKYVEEGTPEFDVEIKKIIDAAENGNPRSLCLTCWVFYPTYLILNLTQSL